MKKGQFSLSDYFEKKRTCGNDRAKAASRTAELVPPEDNIARVRGSELINPFGLSSSESVSENV